jgi:hypothetical protein
MQKQTVQNPIIFQSGLPKMIEAFALDLMRLVRAVRVYPKTHPFIAGLLERIHQNILFDPKGLFAFGVTPTELVAGGDFVGGRAAGLAGFLHSRKILRVLWTREAKPDDVWKFAEVLTSGKIEGEDLRRRLHSEGVYTIDVEPLQLDQIHGDLLAETSESKADQERRRRQAWIALIKKDTPAEQLASVLTSEQFWIDAKSAWADSGLGEAEGFVQMMLQLGERFETALSLIPETQRDIILDHLANMGKSLSTGDLVRILSQQDRECGEIGQGVATLLRDIEGDRFVDLLAGLAAQSEQGTRRLLEIYRRFAPTSDMDELLSLVRARLSLGEGSGFAVEVWKTVEDFILKLMENPFMDSEYSGSLESLADSTDRELSAGKRPELDESPAKYLDHVILALAHDGDPDWQKKLLQRVESLLNQYGALPVLGFIGEIDETIPGLLETRPYFVKRLFKESVSRLRATTEPQARALVKVTLAHESLLLDTALRVLEDEKHLPTRRFLVNLLASFSPAATPLFISRARSGPWYLARNLVIIMGQQGHPQAVSILNSFTKHPHPKVRREALKGLTCALKDRGNHAPARPDAGRKDLDDSLEVFDLSLVPEEAGST